MAYLCKRALLIAVLLFAGVAHAEPAAKKAPAPASAHPTDEELRRLLVERSIREYSGNCPCPYSVDRAGRRCGGRSAWSRPEGSAPYCYPKDIPKEEVDSLRASLPRGP